MPVVCSVLCALLVSVVMQLADFRHANAQSQQRCFALEQQLQRLGSSRRQQSSSRIRAQLSRVNRQYRQARARLERASCYSTFFFTTTLKNSARCRRLDRSSRRLDGQRQRLRAQLNGSSRPSNTQAKRAQIIRALARNNCGGIYQREARRIKRKQGWNPFASVFGEGFGTRDFFDNAPRELPPEDGIRVGSTYRTMCVRQCDGYYFPVSFSTLPRRFQRDAAQCASSCAAPSELFVYRNPGAEVEQMVSLDGRPYKKLENAFRYRKEYIQGCSCRTADYNPLAGTEQAATQQSSSSPATILGDGSTPPGTTGGNEKPAPPVILQEGAKPVPEKPAAALPVPPKPSDVAAGAAAASPTVQ